MELIEDPLAVPRGIANGLCVSMFIWAMALLGARTADLTQFLLP